MTDDPPTEPARMERRIARERSARMAAEQIAERGLRDLYEQQRRLELLRAIAEQSNHADSVEAALLFALDKVCGFADWSLGHVQMAQPGSNGCRVYPTSQWRGRGSLDYADFRAETARARFESGNTLVGRVLRTGSPAWMTSLGSDQDCPRAPAALAAGLETGLAFPVLVGTEVVAVLEFFSNVSRAPDVEILDVMAQVGSLLGRVVERYRAAERLLAKNAELTRAVEEAEAQRQAAEAASRAKSAFLAVTSHEIRTPLNAVLGLAEALRRAPLSPENHSLAVGVCDAGAMLRRLLDAVLDLSQIEAGKMPVRREPFDLARTVTTVVDVWRPRAEDDQIALDLDLSGLPAPCRLNSDCGKIEQTLINLVSNAVKASPPGGRVLVRVGLDRDADAPMVLAEVMDDGPGVPAEEQARIFDAFEQGEMGRRAGGAGLGLSICAGHMALLGGRIGVSERAAGGARFWFAFPAALVAEAEPEAATQASSEDGLTRPLRVLAAEDNAANRQVLKVLLDKAEVALSFAETGEEAVAAVQAEGFDVVLMDVQMPIMDGVSAMRAIREMGGDYADLPIYMLTANVFDEDVKAYLDAGAQGVLRKPIDLAALYEALGAAAARAAGEDRRAA